MLVAAFAKALEFLFPPLPPEPEREERGLLAEIFNIIRTEYISPPPPRLIFPNIPCYWPKELADEHMAELTAIYGPPVKVPALIS